MNNQIPLKYSQNFFTNSSVLKDVLSLTDFNNLDLVIDIGFGKGIITKELSKLVKKVIAIEKDKDLFKSFLNDFIDLQNVKALNQDFLKFNLPNEEYKVFANIPFSITAEIVKKLFETGNPPISAYLFMQKEAASKFIGSPYYKESLMSLMHKPFFTIKIIYNFRKEDFFPIPSKDVCLIEFKLKQNLDLNSTEYSLYKDFITYALTRWKPNIKLALKGIFSNLQLKILSKNLAFSLDSKPTEIEYKVWFLLFKEFLKITPRYKQKLVLGSTNKLINTQTKMRISNKKNINDKFSNSKYSVAKTKSRF